MQQTTTLRRKEHVPQGERTDDRDKAAEEIEQWMEQGEWPLTQSEMAERGEYSRAHYGNVERAYFEEVPADRSASKPARADGGRAQVTIPDDVESKQDYLRGVMAGMEL